MHYVVADTTTARINIGRPKRCAVSAEYTVTIFSKFRPNQLNTAESPIRIQTRYKSGHYEKIGYAFSSADGDEVPVSAS